MKKRKRSAQLKELFRKDFITQLEQLHKDISELRARGKSIQPITPKEADILARLVSRLNGEKGDYSRRYFEEFIESFGKARELRGKGLKVKRPQAPTRVPVNSNKI